MQGLDKYATSPAHRELLDAFEELKTTHAPTVAEHLGISSKTVSSRLARLRAKAAVHGYAPEQDLIHETAPGNILTGVSSYYPATETTPAQWVKQKPEDWRRLESLRIAAEEIAAPLRGCIDPVPPPEHDCDSDLMAVYALGDHHFGMYSWAEETGADYDCDIAEKILHKATRRLGSAAPKAAKGLVLSVGDYLHADNASSKTPQSGHVLDTDSRFARVVQTAIRAAKRRVRYALKKHETVDVVCIEGNHDPMATMWLAFVLSEAFSRDDRVNVVTGPAVHKYLTWGDCLIGMTHGDRGKPADLGQIMSVDQREAWGSAKFCHWYTGHVHHRTLQELRGCTVETLSVLCPGDAWHVGQGYRSQRGMQMDVWHKRQGRIMTVHGTVEYINDV